MSGTHTLPQVINQIVSLIQSKQASSCFVNGPPGSGKTHLLENLSNQLTAHLPGTNNVFGPYTITDFNQPWAGEPLLNSLWRESYLTNHPSECELNDLANTWHWIEKKCQVPQRQTFIVLVDLPYLNDANLPAYCDFLSNVRSLEATWKDKQISLCHVVTGFWDSEKIMDNIQETGVSFPYTEGENYFYWQGISPTDMPSLVKAYLPDTIYYPVIQKVLFELTDGNPALAKKILNKLPDDKLDFTNLVTTAKHIAYKSDMFIQQTTQYLDTKSRSLLGDLLIDQYLPSRIYATYRNHLLTSGLVKEEKLGVETYIRFRSWFYELMVRLHGHLVDIPQETAGRIRIPELMPLIHSLNLELYRLINDIETQARNFVAIQLSLHQDASQPLLQGLHEELKNSAVVDAQQRAEEWRKRAKMHNVAYNDLNPIVSYLSTRDLSTIIKELASDYKVSEWLDIARAIGEMAEIRDAVMHNQLVSDIAVDHLYQLQNQIYSTLNRVKVAKGSSKINF